MDKYDVTKALWDTVYQWAIAHGYTFDYRRFWQSEHASGADD